MALIDSLRRQLRSVIEWQNPEPNVLISRWSENGDEIKNASKLIVNPGQGCFFVYEGAVKAVIVEPGIVNLETDNIPFWTTIKSFMQFFESQHKVGIYFFKTTKILDQKWGTTSPVKYLDPHYKFPVALKAYGNYSFQIADPSYLFINVTGTQDVVRQADFQKVMVARLVEPLSDFLAESGFSFLEVDKHREEISQAVAAKLEPVFRDLGFAISDFRIEGTDFDEDTQRRVGRIADMQAEASALQAVGVNYAQMQQLEALRDAARNEGMAGFGVAMGVGGAFGQNLGQAAAAIPAAVAATAAPAVAQAPAGGSPITTKLIELKQLFDAQLITEAEYNAKKQQLLDQM